MSGQQDRTAKLWEEEERREIHSERPGRLVEGQGHGAACQGSGSRAGPQGPAMGRLVSAPPPPGRRRLDARVRMPSPPHAFCPPQVAWQELLGPRRLPQAQPAAPARVARAKPWEW